MDYISETSSGFSDGAEPMFAIIGYNNVVYWNSHYGPHNDATGFYNALNDAINSFPSTADFSIYNTFNNIEIAKGGTHNRDISNLFWSMAGNPITLTIVGNSNPAIITPTINGSTLTLDASPTNFGVAEITIKGTTPAKEELTWTFTVFVFDQSDLTSGIEDYETGDFSQYTYEYSGDANWFITTTSPYEGTYCAQSGDVGDSQRSDLYLTVDYEYPGTFSCYYKISSENKTQQDDYLYIFINGSNMGNWSGEIPWTQLSANVPAGTNEFAFIYYKDDRGSAGSDCGWIDYLEFLGLPGATGPLTAPANLVTSNDVSNVTLTWDPVVGATSYIVYSSDDPYGTYGIDGDGTFNGEEWSTPTTNPKKFYYVVATDAKTLSVPSTIQRYKPQIIDRPKSINLK